MLGRAELVAQSVFVGWLHLGLLTVDGDLIFGGLDLLSTWRSTMRVSVFTSFVLSLLVSVHCAGAILREQCFNETTGLPCYCIAPAKNMTYILVSTGGAGSLTMTAFLERYSDDVYHLHDPYVLIRRRNRKTIVSFNVSPDI